MPTVQVAPDASGLLQEVADKVGKARKIVVVTGAGISTNSGIPDFRSEHGLYSLIQAQFEKATASGCDGDTANFGGDAHERPLKRRKLSRSDGPAEESRQATVEAADKPPEPEPAVTQPKDATNKQNEAALAAPDSTSTPTGGTGTPSTLQQASLRFTRSRTSMISRPPLPASSTGSSVRSGTNESVFSQPDASGNSSQTEDFALPAEAAAKDSYDTVSTPKRLVSQGPMSSSPLSSPPPVLFDPFEGNARSSETSSQIGYECSDDSDSEDMQSSIDLFASQTSRSSLRNMKGRDLFDCNIWSDPLKTSVFYRFATTLRQKVREVEPTTTHHFIAQLRDKGKLSRVYTQNIDEIEKKIGLSTDLSNGAGNKRRKPVKSTQTSEQDKENGESQEQAKSADEPGDSQGAGEEDQSKTRPTSTFDKGVECVFLHGSLHSLRCFVCRRLCDWDEDGREMRTMAGEQPECPHCAGATAARQERGKRALGIGKLRPDIVLYGEEHPSSDLISPIVQHDLSTGPDLLLVLGTSLRVHGLKVMVKEFAKAVHTKGGKVVFVNFTKPSESTWGDVLDYWVEWDCDAWVEDLKVRKPVLWMSPEAIVEYEKQKREAIAEEKEKKREAIAEEREKKREAIAEEKEKKREAIAEEKEKKREAMAEQKEKKRESLSIRRREVAEERAAAKKRRETIQMPEHGDDAQEPPSPSHLKGAKNPQWNRICYDSGVHVMHQIADAFFNIRGEQFNFFGYTPRDPASAPDSQEVAAPGPKGKKPRKSAPAAMGAALEPEPAPELSPRISRNSARMRKRLLGMDTAPASEAPGASPGISYPATSKAQYRKAARDLRNASTPPPHRMAELYGSYGSYWDHRRDWAAREPLFDTTTPRDTPEPQGPVLPPPIEPPPVEPPVVIEESITVGKDSITVKGPSTSIWAAVKTNPRIRRPKLIYGDEPAVKTRNTRRRKAPPVPLMAPPMSDQGDWPKLPPMLNLLSGGTPRLATMEPNPDVSPLRTLSPNQRYLGLLKHYRMPLRSGQPLMHWDADGHYFDSVPSSPSDQLREETEAAASSVYDYGQSLLGDAMVKQESIDSDM